VSAESVALIPECVECNVRWLPADEERWRAYFGCDENLDEPAEIVILCPLPPIASSAALPRTTGACARSMRTASSAGVIGSAPLARS
jgi:hypothetical protein